MAGRTLALLLLAACGPKRQPQPMADFAGGVVLDLPPPSAEPGSVGGAFFEALVERDVPKGAVTISPVEGLELTCEVRNHHLRVSVIALTEELDESSFARAECPIGGITLPVTIVW